MNAPLLNQPVLLRNRREIPLCKGLFQRPGLFVAPERAQQLPVIPANALRVVYVNGLLHLHGADNGRPVFIVGIGIEPVLRRDKDHQLPTGGFAVPVAPAGGLNDGFQRRQRPIQTVEIQVHTGFDTLGGHHPAGKLFFLPPVNGLNHFRPVSRAEISAEQKDLFYRTTSGQSLIEDSGMGAKVDNGAHVLLLCHSFRNFFQRGGGVDFPTGRGAAQGFVKLAVLR